MDRQRKLLLVDDSPVALLMVQTLLRGSGYVLSEAHDGVQALERVHTDPPDLIVMDMAMPKLDGVGALKALKSSDSTRSIPVIMLTAEGNSEEIERCFEAGCDAYVTKPINVTTLKAQIEALFDRNVAP
ncbi:MAG: response regulator [Myxococcales bacterium]